MLSTRVLEQSWACTVLSIGCLSASACAEYRYTVNSLISVCSVAEDFFTLSVYSNNQGEPEELKLKMPTLGYWKIRGLAQPIRLLLTYVGEEFEDVMYEQGDGPEFSRAAWSDVKAEFAKQLDFANLPYYLDGDVKITQSNAIIRHVARKHKMDGANDIEKAVVDMLLDTQMDFRNGLVRLAYNPDFAKLKDDYLKNVHSSLQLFEKKLTGKPWFAGDNLTAPDFCFYELLDQHRCLQSSIFDSYPNIQGFLKRFEALPKVKEYLQKDEVKNLPMNNKVAAFR